MEDNKMSLGELYFSFFKIGLFTFGGGLAALPIIEKELIDNKKVVTEEEMLDYYAISQTTPGIIMVNVATFIGYKTRGIIGAIIATLGVITPSLIIISLIATLIENFASIRIVQSALKGINAGICATILTSTITLGKKSIKDILGIILCIIAFYISYFTNISIIFVVLIGISIGIIKYLWETKK